MLFFFFCGICVREVLIHFVIYEPVVCVVTVSDLIIYVGVLCFLHSFYGCLGGVGRIHAHILALPAGPCFLDIQTDTQTWNQKYMPPPIGLILYYRNIQQE